MRAGRPTEGASAFSDAPAHHFNGTMCVSHDGLGDAAEHQTLEARPPMRPDDDQVRLPFICRIDNHGTRITFANGGFNR